MFSSFIKKIKENKGIGLVEVVVASAVALIVVLAVTQAYNAYIRYALSNQNNTVANFLLEEGVEVIIFLRDESWTSNIATLTNGTNYYFNFNGTTWRSTTTPEYLGADFSRTFTVSAVNRDGSDDISVSGTPDPDIKKVTVTVSYWQGHSTTTKSISTYITNLYEN